MTSFRIQGGTPLKGAVRLGGAKNASFKLMIAAACGVGESRLLNMSQIGDVDVTYQTLNAIGVKCSRPGDNTVYVVGGVVSGAAIAADEAAGEVLVLAPEDRRHGPCLTGSMKNVNYLITRSRRPS